MYHRFCKYAVEYVLLNIKFYVKNAYSSFILCNLIISRKNTFNGS